MMIYNAKSLRSKENLNNVEKNLVIINGGQKKQK